MIRQRQRNAVPWWLAAAVVVGPLVRCENPALSLPALVYFTWRRYYRTVLVCGAALAAAMAGFSLFLYSLGLGFIPTPVVSHSLPVSSGGRWDVLVHTFRDNLRTQQGSVLALGSLLVLHAASGSMRRRGDWPLAVWAAVATVLHLGAGKFGAFFRYEVSIWSVVLLLLHAYRRPFGRIAASKPILPIVLPACAFVGTVCQPYIRALLRTPLGANNIFEQQCHMHRFVTEYYRAPVGANDIGCVSYRNGEYVPDLWGPGSKSAHDLRTAREDPAWMNAVAKEHKVQLAMLYDEWFDALPASRIPPGEVHLGKRRITPAPGASGTSIPILM